MNPIKAKQCTDLGSISNVKKNAQFQQTLVPLKN